MAGNNDMSAKQVVREAMEVWLNKYKKGSVKTATFNRLIISFNLLARYKVANVRLIDLCTNDIQEYINALATDGYSLSTIKKAYNLLTAFIRYCLGEGMAIRPAHLNVHLPKAENVQKKKKQIAAYEPDEQESIRKAIEKLDTPGARATLLMLETGMRVGEILALRWSDVQWQRRAIRIHSTLVNPQSRKKSYVQESPKSKSSIRTIPLSRRAMELLFRMKRSDESLIFLDAETGKSIGYNTLRNQIRAVCEESGVPYYGAHAFRHTFATNAYYKGCEIKILSKLLGHASVTITYNTYIHLYGDSLEEMRGIVD